jgi:uncharacterized membrane protein YdjX (TVP38/TMEM64 family)
MSGIRIRARLALPPLFMLTAHSASAHIPQRRGRLVDLVSRSSLIGLSASERQALERLRADPATDASLRPIVAGLISSAPPAEAAPAAADSGEDADAESRWSWLPDDLSASALQRYMQRLGNRPFAPLWIAAVYVAAGMIAVPLTVLIIATLVTYGALHGIPYALFGAVASAAVTFGVGRAMGELTVKRLFGTRFESVDRLARCNVMEMTVVRMLPVAPFSLVNIIAGGAGIPFTSFLGGTVLGVAPGIAAFALVTSGLTGTGGAAVVSAAAGVLVLALLAAARRWARTENSLAARLQQWQRERSPR